MVIKEDTFPLFSQMFLFIGVISATKENIVKHICFIMKWVIITHLKLYCDTILNSHPVTKGSVVRFSPLNYCTVIFTSLSGHGHP